ncbi:VOC family protein [Paenibacillaceae bacterium]|nr:VOC family protein [Paenibacillaceae bacterium]
MKPLKNSVIPILRIFDIQLAKAFYLDYLFFKLDWTHQFDNNAPLYVQISWGSCVIHLSEHHGDCTPGAALRIAVDQIEQLHEALHSKAYPYANPGLETTPWNTREVTVTDPFGNRLMFYEPLSERSSSGEEGQ